MATTSHSVAARPQLWRISDRTTFADLRRRGRRARAGALTVTWLAPDAAAPTAPRVAISVARGAGAVLRNRVRRRIRAGLRELQRRGSLPSGAYLVAATHEVARMPWEALVAALGEAVATATAP